ncbi:MAG: dynamin family protein [Desulfobacterales bacterium]|nr:dynamin family protein [Desulfobacterales bacterium]
MDSNNETKDKLLKINREIVQVIQNIKIIYKNYDSVFEFWEKICLHINNQLNENIIRIGIVGTIKSGKSTFVNYLFNGDHLKRGAGVITSIVTKVRIGKKLNAKLYCKSWEEINNEINQALILFPNFRSDSEGFDIKNKNHRDLLQNSLNQTEMNKMFIDGEKNPNIVLLISYLNGFEKVKDIISDKNSIKEYDENNFNLHTEFVSDDALSVYLKDIQLEIQSESIGNSVEIADCQGSDSTNPLHITMIQDYLLSANFVIYLISSRTGLRSADIKFLSMMKNMGVSENIIFVINCDLNEHESLKGLKTLIQKTKDDLIFFNPLSDIYAFSALYNLFNGNIKFLSKKDKMKLNHWQHEEEMINFSNIETKKFKNYFYNKINNEGLSILYKNHIERLNIVISSILQWIHITKSIIKKDAHSANRAIEDVHGHQAKINKIKLIIKNSLDGAAKKIKSNMKSDIDNFFVNKSKSLMDEIVKFIKNYESPYDKLNNSKDNFVQSIYIIFQQFKRALDFFITETITPKVITFLKENEQHVVDELYEITKTFDSMINDAVYEYSKEIGGIGNLINKTNYQLQSPSISIIKEQYGLKIPHASMMINYNTKMKAEAIMQFSFYSITKFLKKMFKKQETDDQTNKTNALDASIVKIKKETINSIKFFITDYKENVKFQYALKFVDSVSDYLYEGLTSHFSAYTADLDKLSYIMNKTEFSKKEIIEALNRNETICKNIKESISL